VEQELAKGVSWGMMEDAEEFPDMEQVKYVLLISPEYDVR
jgi:hypothetical protein